jgi:RecB family endonuclease NucS
MRPAAAYLLLADDHTYRCRDWDQPVEKLLWAHQSGCTTAKARRTTMDSDRPLIPSESFALVEVATKVAMAEFSEERRVTVGA